MHRLAILAAAALAACGSSTPDTPDAGQQAVTLPDAGPQPGGACPSDDVATCSTDRAMLACERGTWARYACAGPDGCLSSSVSVRCDMTTADAGAPCPVRWEAAAICRRAGDGGVSHERLTCTGGRFASEACGVACSESGGRVLCN